MKTLPKMAKYSLQELQAAQSTAWSVGFHMAVYSELERRKHLINVFG